MFCQTALWLLALAALQLAGIFMALLMAIRLERVSRILCSTLTTMRTLMVVPGAEDSRGPSESSR